ncbi:MAG: hypothetical protein ACI8Q1_000725 [Parvicella sp.]|jgi:hypothetical protein
MKQLFTCAVLLLLTNLYAMDGRLEKSMIPLIIGEEVPDSTVHEDSCRFYLQVEDHYNPNEADSLIVSIFHNDVKSFPNFKFFNLITDSNGMAQLTYVPGKYFVQISKKCTPEFKQDFQFTIDSLQHSRSIYSNITQLDPNMMIEVDKPVIYCYPEVEMEVDIKLNTTANLTFTYPQLNDSWKTTLYPNGDIKVMDKMYPYLFWEGKMKLSDIASTNKGFVIKKDEAVSFFETRLAQIGLTQREITDFITYWCPKMHADSYHIQFLIGSDYNANIGTLDYSVQPDTEIRIFALIKEYNGSEITEQILTTIERKGFTVVEWGGSIIPSKLINL